MEDDDFAFALSLQEEFSSTFSNGGKNTRKRERPTSVVDECWEIIDPTPDVRQLFLEFNDTYFEGKLAGCEVRWSPRMTLCAGLCCYEGRGGLCSIRLSVPLLKLRPRKDLVQTLLHEMIHALLFVTNNNKDHDGHGPEFHKHMYRINKQSGANITVYHNFHDEVNSYRQHWWKCNGPCQKRPPYYGMVKRSMNRAPSPNDLWWADHQRSCGGTYSKVKEPEDYGKKKKQASKDESTKASKHGQKKDSLVSGMPKIDQLWWKEEPSNTKDKENSIPESNIVESGHQTIVPFSGKGFVLGAKKTESATVTRPWLADTGLSRNESFTSRALDIEEHDIAIISSKIPENNSRNISNDKKLKTTPANSQDQKSSKKKGPKSESTGTIIDAFKRAENSEKKPVIVIDDSPVRFVECPLCQGKVKENLINLHLDECLTK